MAKVKITLNDVAKKHIKIIIYLIVSGVLGIALAKLANRPELAMVFAPAINYILYILKIEIDQEGVIKALKNEA